MRIASFSAGILIVGALTLAGFGFPAARQQTKETAAKTVPYTVTYDENGMLIRISVAADTDKDQLRATLRNVADKHRDDPARDYVLDYLQVEAYLEAEGQVSKIPAARLKRYVPPLPPNARAGAKTKPDEFAFDVEKARKSLVAKPPKKT